MAAGSSSERRVKGVGARTIRAARGRQELNDQCRTEVVELHEFFADWFNGVLADTDDVFDRFASVMVEEFVILSPEGRSCGRTELLSRLRAAHGCHGQSGDAIRIRIDNYTHRVTEASISVATYEEWQEIGESSRGRLSTAVFRKRADAPNGVEWLHLHEVWLPRAAN